MTYGKALEKRAQAIYGSQALRHLKKIAEARVLQQEACYCHPSNECFDDCAQAGREGLAIALEEAALFLKTLPE